ncbi:MAG: PKD domain-containing protein [Planctomycetes bacterium]|nr:PKD domain-containing protein [Planctomycetota bacterium]
MTIRKLKSKINRSFQKNKKPSPDLKLESLERRLLLNGEPFSVEAINTGPLTPDGNAIDIEDEGYYDYGFAHYNYGFVPQSYVLTNNHNLGGPYLEDIYVSELSVEVCGFTNHQPWQEGEGIHLEPEIGSIWMLNGASAEFTISMDPFPLDAHFGLVSFMYEYYVPPEPDVHEGYWATDNFEFVLEGYINAPPIANAGSDQTVYEGDVVTFSGTYDDPNARDDDPLTFSWNFDDNSANALTQNTTHVYANEGVYNVMFGIVDDHNGDSGDTVIITVLNAAPTANAGGPYIVDEGFGGTLKLNGSATDPGVSDILSYAWDLDNDGTFGDLGFTTLDPTIDWQNMVDLDLPSDGSERTIALQVTDSDGGVGVAHTTLTINNLDPLFEVITDSYIIDEGQPLILNGNGFYDPDGRDEPNFTYSWDLDGNGDYEIVNHPNPTFTVPWADLEALNLPSDNSTLFMGLRVEDGEGGVTTIVHDSDGAPTLTINNLAPDAEIFAVPFVFEGEDVLLNGFGSSDPGNDPLRYEWGVQGIGDMDFGEDGDTLLAPWQVTELFSGILQSDTLWVTLTVTETVGSTPLSNTTTYPIYIENVHPTADAGGAYTINEGEDLGLDGSSSSDPNANDVLYYFWDVNNNGDYFDDNVTGVNPIVPWADLEPMILASDGSILEIPLLVLDENPDVPDDTQTIDDDGPFDHITRSYDEDVAYLAINNLAAEVNAGEPYVVNEGFGGTLSFEGFAMDPDGNDEHTYAWDLNNDGIFGGPNEPTGPTPDVTTWNDLVALGLPSDTSAQTIWLRADDGEGGVGYAHTTLTINNLNPHAVTGDYSIFEGGNLYLNASGSNDPDSRDVLSYAWDLDNDGDYEYTGDPTGMRSVPWSTLETMALASNGSDLTIVLRVDDGQGGVDIEEATLVINNVNPIADANGDYVIDEGEDLVLDATATTDPDANDVLTFEWDLDDDGYYDDAVGINPTLDWATVEALALPSNGTELPIALRVTDSDGGEGYAGASLYINNVDPTADAGGPYTIVEGQGLEGANQLDGGGSTDPDANDILSYAWDLDNDGYFDDASGVTAEVPWDTLYGLGLDSDGTSLVVNLQVTDSDGGVDTDKALLLVVANDAPIAHAGGAYEIYEGQSLPLNASATTDPGQDPLTFLWDLDDDGVYDDAAGVNPIVPWATLEALGLASNGDTLDISVRVDDGEEGGVGFATTTLNIYNVNPTADADGDYVIDEGQELTLDATGTTDPDANDVLTYAWDLDDDGYYDDASGVNPTLDWATVEALDLPSNGTELLITLRVTDSDGGVDFDTSYLTINNVNPTAYADGPRTILEGDSLTLDASASTDPDANDILTYAWDLDADGYFDDAYGSNPLITWTLIEDLGLATDGSPLVIEVLVVDSDGGSDTDTTELMITNVAPTVDAGPDFVNLMGEEAFFDGSFFDPAGLRDTHTYLWDFGDGHTATTLDATHIYTYSGYYTATLTVTDSDGAHTTDTTEVTVEEEIEVIDGKAFYHNITGTIVVTLFGPGDMRIFHINESGIDFNRIELTDTTEDSRLIFRPEEFHPHFVIGDILVGASEGDYQPDTLETSSENGDDPITGSLGKIRGNKGFLVGDILVPGSLANVRLDRIGEDASIVTGDGPLEKVNVKFDIEGALESDTFIKKVISRKGGLTSTGAIIAHDGNIDTAKFADDVAGTVNASAEVGKVLSQKSTLSGTVRAGDAIGKVRFDNIDSALISSGGDIDLIFSKTSIDETIMLAGTDIGADLIPDSGDDFFNANGAEIAKIKVHPKKGDFFNSNALAGVRPFDYNPVTDTWTILAPVGQTQQVASFGEIGNAVVGQVFLNGDPGVGTYGLFAATNVDKVKFVEVAGAGAPDFEIIGTW